MAVELRRCGLELVRPIRASFTAHHRRPVVLVRLLDEDGLEGWGECDALAERVYAGEDANASAHALATRLVPALGSGRLDEDDPVADLVARLRVVPGSAFAKAALEMAVLDAWLRRSARSLASFLGATRTTVTASATISLASVDAVVAAVADAAGDGYRRVKCKIAPGHDVAPLAALRRAFPDLAVVADANGAYDPRQAEQRRALAQLDELGLVALEQPLARGDLDASARLCAALSTPVLLDESIGGLADLKAALERGAGDGVVVKPGRLGGILAARELARRAADAGLHVVLGGMFETGLARAAHLCLAATSIFDLPGDLGASARYFVPDLAGPHRLIGGELAVPDGPGLGLRPDPAVLASCSEASAFGRPGEALSWTGA